MVARIYEYTKIHCIVHFKWVNSVVCELSHNAVKKENSTIYILSPVL